MTATDPLFTKRVLDHGFIHLVDAMPHWSNDDSATGHSPADARIIQAARVSMAHMQPEWLTEAGISPEKDRTHEQDRNLIFYMMRERHTSPFEKVRFEFAVRLPIFVARQWIRHRMGSFNESSARYAPMPDVFYEPELDRMAAQAERNKQASGAILDPSSAAFCQNVIKEQRLLAYQAYKELLDRGLARELARTVLPLNIYTSWYWTVDLHNLFGFLSQRCAQGAQYEIRVYADAILEMVEEIAPVATAAFKMYMLKQPV